MAETLTPREQLLEDMWRDPASRLHLQNAMAARYPNAAVPGMAERKAAETIATTLSEKTAAVDAKLAELDRRLAYDAATKPLREKGYSDADIEAVEKIMKDEGVGTHTAAASVYEARRTVATPRSVSVDRSMRVPGVGKGGNWAQFFDGIVTDPDGWGRAATEKILGDFAKDESGRLLNPSAAARWESGDYWPKLDGYEPSQKPKTTN